MSDTQTETAEVTAEAAPETAPTPDPAPAQETDWKAEARKWEARAKENTEAAKRLAEIEEASKTEAQKQAEALEAAQAKVKEYETREQIAKWKAEVAEVTGVPAVALAGSTKEELEAHAATLKPLIGKAARGPIVASQGEHPDAINHSTGLGAFVEAFGQ